MSGGGKRILAAAAAATSAALLPLLVMVATSETGELGCSLEPRGSGASTSTASTTPVAVNNSPPSEPQLDRASVPGCYPKELIDDIVTNCQDSSRPTEKCCIVAVGTVARPACYCLVKQELAFRLSPLLNKTNMVKFIANCGASPLLDNSLDTPCGGSSHDDQIMGSSHGERTMGDYGCAVLETATILNGCSLYKIAAFILWPLVAVLMIAVVFWRPVPLAPVIEGKEALIEGKKDIR